MRVALTMILVMLLTACGAATAPSGADAATTPASATAPAATAEPAATSEPAATAEPAGTAIAPGSPEARALEGLARNTGVGADALVLTSKEAQEWPDGSLGCPEPGTMYTQALVSGYKLTFSDGTNTYNVHTDESGSRAVFCQNNLPVDLEGLGG